PNTEEELLEYCYFVAGAVGILMARIMGVQQSEVLLRACDLGLAFQLTNIARDVVEDARAQRYYLPQHWLNEQGLQADDLTNTDCSERIYPLVCRLVQMAEPYYQSANIGIRALPGRAAWAIATARAVYRDIGLQLLAQPSTVIQQRSYTRRSRKVWRITTGALQVAGGRMLSHRSVRNSALWTPRSLNEWA
ncbi:MAG: squalene/phytoene synthase family protein, partial [Pseudomonadota bacterium]